MQKKEFIRQLNELIPRPDPVTTEALYRFDRECAESEYMDMLTALRVVARNFSEETLQGVYEIIQHQNAALPSEMFAAAVYLQAGRTPAEVSGLAREGRLMGFFGPERPEEPSRIAGLYYCGVRAGTAVLHYGLWTVQPTACIEGGHRIWPESRHIRHPGHGLPHPGSPGVCRKTRRAPLYPAWLGVRAHPRPCSRSSRTAPPWPPISPVMRIWASQRWPITRCGWNGARARRPCSNRCKKCWLLRARCGMLCACQGIGGGKTMNYQKKQDICRGSTGGQLPFGGAGLFYSDDTCGKMKGGKASCRMYQRSGWSSCGISSP